MFLYKQAFTGKSLLPGNGFLGVGLMEMELWYILTTPVPPFLPLKAPLGKKFWKLSEGFYLLFPLKDVTVKS